MLCFSRVINSNHTHRALVVIVSGEHINVPGISAVGTSKPERNNAELNAEIDRVERTIVIDKYYRRED